MLSLLCRTKGYISQLLFFLFLGIHGRDIIMLSVGNEHRGDAVEGGFFHNGGSDAGSHVSPRMHFAKSLCEKVGMVESYGVVGRCLVCGIHSEEEDAVWVSFVEEAETLAQVERGVVPWIQFLQWRFLLGFYRLINLFVRAFHCSNLITGEYPSNGEKFCVYTVYVLATDTTIYLRTGRDKDAFFSVFRPSKQSSCDGGNIYELANPLHRLNQGGVISITTLICKRFRAPKSEHMTTEQFSELTQSCIELGQSFCSKVPGEPINTFIVFKASTDQTCTYPHKLRQSCQLHVMFNQILIKRILRYLHL